MGGQSVPPVVCIMVIVGENMTVLEIYEKVNYGQPIEQRRFINYFNDTLYELSALYGDRHLKLLTPPGVKIEEIQTMDDDICVLPLYHVAIIDNILFLAGSGDEHKGEFLRKSKEAFLKYWDEAAKGKKIRRRGF